MRSWMLGCMAVGLMSGCASDEDKGPRVADIAQSWQAIVPGGETTCARGGEFKFFVRGGSVNKVAIVFDGGGACWDALTCSIADQVFSPVVDETETLLTEVGDGTGAYDNPENPLKDWFTVFIPYCSGDIHWGDSVTTYGGGDSGFPEVTISHKGRANVQSALDWVYENFEAPERIMVTGYSAGSYGSLGWAPHIIEHYPDSNVVQVGDCGAGVITETFFQDSFPSWNAADIVPTWVDGLDVPIEEIALSDFYINLSNHYPEQRFSQINTNNDENQRFFYEAMGGLDADWSPKMNASIDAIVAAAPTFRSYIGWGEQHVLSPYAEFYTMQVDGVRLRDWVADLIEGREVENVKCTDCVTEELYVP